MGGTERDTVRIVGADSEIGKGDLGRRSFNGNGAAAVLIDI